MTGVDSGGALGIVMTVAVVAGIVLMLLLWRKAGQGLDDEEQTLLAGSKEGVAAGESTGQTKAEIQQDTGNGQEPTSTEESPYTGDEQESTSTEESSDTRDVPVP